MSGNQPEDADARYCEVIQVGIEDDTAEVTIFYTPEGGKLQFMYSLRAVSFEPTIHTRCSARLLARCFKISMEQTFKNKIFFHP